MLMLMMLNMMSVIDNDDSDVDVDHVHTIRLLVVTLMEIIIQINGDDNFDVDEGYVVADVGSGDYFDAHDVDDRDDLCLDTRARHVNILFSRSRPP